MAKGKTTAYFCQECGHEASKWMGQCPACKAWNSMVEEPTIKIKSETVKQSNRVGGILTKLSEICTGEEERIHTGLLELDRVLGGGIVPASLILVGGDPGIGKSTLLLQICRTLSEEKKVLYISGEESLKQIKLRADRLGSFPEGLLLYCETSLDTIESVIEKEKPNIVIIDSIQTMYKEEVASAPGSVSQVRESTASLMRIAKGMGISVFIVGHVTKEGVVAGPRV